MSDDRYQLAEDLRDVGEAAGELLVCVIEAGMTAVHLIRRWISTWRSSDIPEQP